MASGVAGGAVVFLLTTDNWQLTPEALPLWGQATEVHVMDALAITGDEGRGNLRKAPGSW